jgi:transmembrane sensor
VDLVRGQAFFQVNKDAVRPFIVRTGEADVRAVGTQFDVYRSRGGAIVTVVEGRVAVTQASGGGVQMSGQKAMAEPLYLVAGEQVTVGAEKVPHPVHTDVATATAWTERKLVFEGAALGHVVEEFNRYNVRRVVIADPELEEVHVRGAFAANNPQRLVEFLQQRFSLTIEETQEEIRISLKR